MPGRDPSNDHEYEAILVAAPIDSNGNLVDVEQDESARNALHRRVDRLGRGDLGRVVKAAKRQGLTKYPDGAEILHAAIDRVLIYNRLVTSLRLDRTVYLATGEDLGDRLGAEEYGLMAALQESGILEDPITDADTRLRTQLTAAEDSRPIAAWIAGLILDTSSGGRLPEAELARLGDWCREGGDSNEGHSLSIPSFLPPEGL